MQFTSFRFKQLSMLKPYLVIRQTEAMGKGVFTTARIPADTIVEFAPVIVMDKQDRIYLDKTLLHNYIFEWGKNNDQCCLALGYVSMYNHSYTSNCEYIMDFEKQLMFIQTVRTIKKGEELTINYNGDWDDAKKLWFDAI
jgi:uncharacterized protein